MGMRLGGPFPFNFSGSFPVVLAGGQVLYLPAGNFLGTLGSQTCLQWFDPVAYAWRNVAPNAETFQISCDGYNWRLINLSGVVQGATITAAGSGGTNGIGPTQTGSTVTFAAGSANTGGQATGYAIVGGSLPALSVFQAGSGFLAPPLILIDPPPLGGIQATATCALNTAGAIASATLTNVGAGYISLPNVYVIPQFAQYPGLPTLPYTLPSSGPVQPNVPPGLIANQPPGPFCAQGQSPAFPATAGALINFGAGVLGGSGTLTGVVVSTNGYGYTAVPAVSFGGTSLGAAAATALMSWGVTAITGSGGAGYTVGNPVESALGALTTGLTGGFYNNGLMLPRQFRGRLTSTAGAVAIEDPGFGIQTLLGVGNFGVAIGGSIPGTTVTFSGITMGGVTDVSILQMMVD